MGLDLFTICLFRSLPLPCSYFVSKDKMSYANAETAPYVRESTKPAEIYPVSVSAGMGLERQMLS